MKILILTQTFPLNPNDSTAPFMYDFARGFADLDNQVFILLPFNPKLKVRSFKKIKLITFRYIWPDFLHLLGYGNTLENDQRLKWFVYFLAPFYYFFAIIKLYSVVSKHGIQIINAHWILPNGFIAAIVSKLTGVPLVITVPGSDAFIAKQNFMFKIATEFALSSAKKIISNSPQLLKDLNVQGKIISYPVPLNSQPRTKNSQLIIATAGRNVEKKGFGIVKKVIPDIEIISGLPIKEFRTKLTSVDIFIAFSVRDSQGNLDDASLTVIEAMAAGCCVVVSDLPGYRRIIKDGVNGFLINTDNLSGLKKLINNLYENRELVKKIGQDAREKVMRSLTSKKTASLYLNLFKGYDGF